jgi:predicted alpha/beta-fold hydrolase
MSAGTETFQPSVNEQGPSADGVLDSLAPVARSLAEKPFVPHPLFANGHAQTLAAYAWPRRGRLKAHARDEARLFEVEPGVRLLGHCRWQADREEHPTMLLLHGLEGSNESVYILGTTDKAHRAGFNVVRLNLRTCGKTEHLTPTLYHSGLTGDILFVIRELIEKERFDEIYLVGFSMSGNMSLRLAGEEADHLPPELRAVCAISPSVDLVATARVISRRENWIYQQSFMRSLRARMRLKHKLSPELYDIRGLNRVRSIREFDERFTARYGGFRDADDYYARTSSFPVLPRIRKPTLIIHAEDDPLIPFEPLRHPSVAENPYIILLSTRRGGHVGFVAGETDGEDRFWAENRIVQFCRLIHERR